MRGESLRIEIANERRGVSAASASRSYSARLLITAEGAKLFC
jgi:hypothetical protein